MRIGMNDGIMTEKRFILDPCINHFIDAQQETWCEYNLDEVENLLNELHDENEQLREEIKDFQDLLTNRESELLKPVWDKIYSEFENIVYAEKGAIINLLNECYDEIMKKELQE